MFHQKKNRLILSCCLLFVTLCGIGAAWAWNMHQVSVENVLQSRTVDSIIDENFDPGTQTGTVTKEVSFENTGTAAVFLRFAYAEYWETETELLEGFTDEDSVQKNWSATFSTDWTEGSDGWYYYNYVLTAGDSVDNVLSSVTFGDDIPEDASYTLMFQMETLQVSDENAVNIHATELLFGMTGTVSDAVCVEGAVVSGTVEWEKISTVSVLRAFTSISSGNGDVSTADVDSDATESDTPSMDITAGEGVAASDTTDEDAAEPVVVDEEVVA